MNIFTAISFFKKIRFTLPPKKEILIYDDVGSDALNQTLALNHDYIVLPVRNELFFAHPFIIFAVLCNYFTIVKRIRLAYELACLQIIKPKVILTFIDTSSDFQTLSQLFPQAKFIRFQNGLRVHNTLKTFNKKTPAIFCFGERDVELYKMNQIEVDDITPVGSLKSSYFIETVAKTFKNEIKYDLCLISQYQTGMEIENNTIRIAEPPIRLYYDWFPVVCSYLKKYIDKEKLSLVIAGVRENGSNQSEIAFFQKYFGTSVEIVPLDQLSYSSYKLALNSSIIVSCNSTLAFEALSWGKKVLFSPNQKTENIAFHLSNADFYNTKETSYEEFEKKLNYLKNTEQSTYEKEISASSDFFIARKKDSLQIVKNYISDYLTERLK